MVFGPRRVILQVKILFYPPRFIYTHQILVYNQGGEDEVL